MRSALPLVALLLVGCGQVPSAAPDSACDPDAKDVCDFIDNDCDGFVDEDEPPTAVWHDKDGDGFGDASLPAFSVCVPGGSQVTNADDCDDTDDEIHPDAKDVCDFVDNDCDRFVDEDEPPTKVWHDKDGDGFGDGSLPAFSVCVPGGSQVTNAADCDDTDDEIHPDAKDECDFVDNDCDYFVDEDDPPTKVWHDADGDGFGDPYLPAFSVCVPGSAQVTNNDDCDDAAASVRPGATETCNGIDDDCDGTPDEGGVCISGVCGDIRSNETWASGDTIHVTCDVVVRNGATLTIEDGVTVEFDAGAGLSVGTVNQGTVSVEGLGTGVVFTSSAASPAPGDWDGLVFGPADGGSYLRGLTVAFGGDQTACFALQAASISAEDLTVSDCAGPAAVTATDGTLSLYHSTIEDNLGAGVSIAADGDIFYWHDVVVTGNGDVPIRAPAWALYVLASDTASSTLSGNTVDEVEVLGGQLDGVGWLGNYGIPYVLTGDLDVSAPGGVASLFLDPGVELQVVAGAEILVGVGGGGVLTASGTAGQPVLITSAEASPAPGDWQGITFGTGDGGSRLDEVTVSYGGGNGYGNLLFAGVGSWPPSVTGGVVTHSSSWGIYRAGGAAPALSGITFGNNASGDVY